MGYPITDEQIIPLIRLIKASHGKDREELLTAALNTLMYLVYSKAKNYKSQPYYDDMLQEGKIGLIMAINDFDEEKGNKFFWFADWFLKTRMKYALKTYLFKPKEVYKACAGLDQEDYYYDPDPVEESQIKDVIVSEVNRLDDRAKEILTLKYGLDGNHPLTFREIGEMKNVSRQRIEQIKATALNKLSKRRVVKDLHFGGV